MEYDSPIKEGATTYTIPIGTSQYLNVKYPSVVSGSHTTPPADLFEFTSYIANMASMYEEYSKKWFNRQILSIFFIKNLAYDWNYMGHEPYKSPPKYESVPIEVQQIWCPVKISVQLNKFTIHWKLLNSNYRHPEPESITPEDTTTKKSVEVPYSKNQIMMVLNKTPRSEYHRKIRKARLTLAASKVRFQNLLLRYTEKYGELDMDEDNESVLTMDSQDE
jgi:hypothetical protein